MDLNVTVRLIDGPSMANRVISPEARKSILRQCGAKLKWLTVQNFGDTGKDRPSRWNALSPKYARRVGRTHATLFLRGDLLRSLRVSPATEESIEVYTEDPKAEAHQFGNPDNNLPARPFFPITPDGDLTPYARRVLEQTAKLEMERLLRAL